MHVALESPRQQDVIALIAELDAYQDTLYPAEARYALDLDSLAQPNVLFVVARSTDDRAIGCAAVVLVFIPFVGWLLGLGAWFGLLALWIIGLLAAINGEQKPVPVLGTHFQNWFGHAFD